MGLNVAQTQDFQNFCNSFGAGYLKQHKAHDMLVTLHDIPAIQADPDRLLRYLENCLEMEGFRTQDIKAIREWLITNN